MEFWHGLAVITGVHLLAVASPGPDFVLVTQQTLTQGRRVGLLTCLGIALGLGVHVIYSVLELATVIAHSAWLLTAIKWLGGAYLIYLGWQGIRSKPAPLAETPQPVETKTDLPVLKNAPYRPFSIIKRGFFCNVFNPKAPVYFVAVFTLVLSPDMPFWQLASYGVWMMVLQMAWFSAVVMLLSAPAVLNQFQSVSHWIDRIMGVAMIGLGIGLLVRKG